jgi:uncharacterized protein YkwD
MSQHLKHFFIPHEGNNYHPHILHTKRAVFYTAFFLSLKAMVFLFAMLIPSVVFVMPDVLASEENKLLTLTNNLRTQQGLPALSGMVALHVSSDLKATDMADLHYFSHTNPKGYGLAHYLSTAGYRYETAGENLAMGFSSAEEIFSGWVKSPTHYANLIDPDFKEFGVSMESGTYNDLATVYVAQHFGSPKVVPEKAFPESLEKVAAGTAALRVVDSAPVAKSETAKSSEVKTKALAKVVPKVVEKSEAKVAMIVPSAPVTSTTSTLAAVPVPVPLAVIDVAPGRSEPIVRQAHFIAEDSFLDWKEENNKTILSATVHILGDVASAVLTVNNHSLNLERKSDDGFFYATLTVDEAADNFFKPVVDPSLQIRGRDGQTINAVVSWKQIKVLSPSPLEKYMRARDVGSSVSRIFDFSRGVYLFFLVFFSLALILSIVIEIRRQHHHIIVQTVGLIVLLATLILS